MFFYLGCFHNIALPLPTSKWNGRCWSLMAGSLLDPRVINNKTLLSVTGGSVVIQMTGIKRWFYLLGIRNISIINFHQQQQSVWRDQKSKVYNKAEKFPTGASFLVQSKQRNITICSPIHVQTKKNKNYIYILSNAQIQTYTLQAR